MSSRISGGGSRSSGMAQRPILASISPESGGGRHHREGHRDQEPHEQRRCPPEHGRCLPVEQAADRQAEQLLRPEPGQRDAPGQRVSIARLPAPGHPATEGQAQHEDRGREGADGRPARNENTISVAAPGQKAQPASIPPRATWRQQRCRRCRQAWARGTSAGRPARCRSPVRRKGARARPCIAGSPAAGRSAASRPGCR